MIIELHDELLHRGVADDSTAVGSIRYALELLALGRIEGKHLLYGDPRVIEGLAELSGVSPRTTAVLRRVAMNVVQKEQLVNNTSRRILLRGVDAEPRIDESSGRSVITLPVSIITDSSFIQPAVLLAEHITDAEIYLLMARVFAVLRGMPPGAVRADVRGGGGSATGSCYSRVQRDGRLCVCIVDSDRNSPEGALGNTARAVKWANDENIYTSEWTEINARTIENLLPPSLVEAVCTERGMDVTVAFTLERLAESEASAATLYLDIKKGTSYAEVFQMSLTAPDAAFYQRLLEDLMFVVQPHNPDCALEERCVTPDRCSCPLNNALQSIVPSSHDYLGRMTPHKIAEAVASAGVVLHEWQRLGQLVYSWCCAGEVMSAP